MFIKRFPGAAKLDFSIRNTQDEAFGTDHGIKDRVKGAYYPQSKQVLLIAGNVSNIGEAQQTLQHEVLVHHGLNLFEPSVKRKILETVIASRD